MKEKKKDEELGRELYRLMQAEKKIKRQNTGINKTAKWFVALVVIVLLVSYLLYLALSSL